MRTKWLGLALVLLGSHAWAQVGELYNADVTGNTSITDPARAVKAAEGQWLAQSDDDKTIAALTELLTH